MPGRKKIAFLIPNLQGGGAERVFVTLLRRLDRKRFEPQLVVGRLEGAYVADIPTDVVPVELGGVRARNVLGTLPAWIRATRPDLVFATTGFAVAAALTRPGWPRYTVLVSRLANTLSAFYEDVARESPYRAALYRWLNRVLYLGSDVVVCQSDYMLDDAWWELGLGRAKLCRIYNPVDVAHIQSRSLEHPASLRGIGPHLVAVGNLHWRKGYDVLLRSFALLHPRWPSATLTIFGEGQERRALERLSCDLHVADSISLPGFAENPYPVVRSADLLVSASRYEGFSNVIVEALALGRPIVVTDCPSANREVIRHGVGGRLAPVDSPDGLARELDHALHGLAELRRSVACLSIEKRFGVGTIVQQYESLFARLTVSS